MEAHTKTNSKSLRQVTLHHPLAYRNLQFYIKRGLILTKIHRVVSFTQRPWLKPWVDLCTAERQNAKSDFEADLAKLSVNATFGKTVENVRNRQNIRLISDPSKLLKAVSKPSLREATSLVLSRVLENTIRAVYSIRIGSHHH